MDARFSFSIRDHMIQDNTKRWFCFFFFIDRSLYVFTMWSSLHSSQTTKTNWTETDETKSSGFFFFLLQGSVGPFFKIFINDFISFTLNNF